MPWAGLRSPEKRFAEDCGRGNAWILLSLMPMNGPAGAKAREPEGKITALYRARAEARSLGGFSRISHSHRLSGPRATRAPFVAHSHRICGAVTLSRRRRARIPVIDRARCDHLRSLRTMPLAKHH